MRRLNARYAQDRTTMFSDEVEKNRAPQTGRTPTKPLVNGHDRLLTPHPDPHRSHHGPTAPPVPLPRAFGGIAPGLQLPETRSGFLGLLGDVALHHGEATKGSFDPVTMHGGT